MILWYRLPGLVAVFGLSMYSVLMLTVFKFLPVTLTAPGIAGFILSIGMAVDAHILIFERVKEEIRSGKDVLTSISDGFSRAWLSIRDGNVTGILTAVILFYTTTSLVRGFALTLLLGITLSLFTAVAITHTLLNAVAPKKMSPAVKFLFGNGLSK
jgi:protein-export membrane protein SecD